MSHGERHITDSDPVVWGSPAGTGWALLLPFAGRSPTQFAERAALYDDAYACH
jgi:hypothetical protein